MSIKTQKEELVSKTINVLNEYENVIKNTEKEGDIEEEVLSLCYHKEELDPYWNALVLKNVFKAISKPRIQKVLLEEINESNLNDFVDLLDVQIDFFLAMDKNQFNAMLTRWDLETYPCRYETRDLNYLIEETERKMKSCRHRKLATEAL